MKEYKNCQSCGMPLSKYPEKGGNDIDGTKNVMYCSYCYKEGKFTQPDITVAEMKIVCKQKLKEMGFPAFIAGFLTSGLPKLERWKNN